MPTASQPNPARPIPHIDILFLGSPSVGKASFLSRLPSVQHPSLAKKRPGQQDSQPPTPSSISNLASPSTTTLPPIPSADTPPPPYTSTPPAPSPLSTSNPPASQCSSSPNDSTDTLPTSPRVPPLSGPLHFTVSLFARPYHISIHPSTSALFIDAFPTSPPPKFAIIAFAIPDRVSLYNAQHYWLPQLRQHYPDEEGMKVMLLGLQRDARTDRKVRKRDWSGKQGGGGGVRATGSRQQWSRNGNAEVDEEYEYECVMPEEGLQAAREMRIDRYAECSARTGELMWEVVEDITRTAAKTTVEDGRGSDGSCGVM